MSRIRIIAFLVAVAALAGAAFVLPLGAWALALVEQARDLGPAGAVAYGAAYVLATVLLIPGSLLTLGAGFLYGLGGGLAVVWPAAVLGATLAFALGRSVARGWVGRRVAGSQRMAALDEATGEHGFSIVFLLRLSPVFPFALLNYALGLTRARFQDYVVASAFGMLPGTLLYVYLGTLITSAAALTAGERPDAGLAQRILFWGGLLATAVVTVWMSRLARKKLAIFAPASAPGARERAGSGQSR